MDKILRKFKSFDTAAQFAKRSAVKTNTVHCLREVKGLRDFSNPVWEVEPLETIESATKWHQWHDDWSELDQREEDWEYQKTLLTRDELEYFEPDQHHVNVSQNLDLMYEIEAALALQKEL